MPRLNETFCATALEKVKTMNTEDYTETPVVLEDDAWRIRVHWFPATTTFPTPMVEVIATDKTTKKKAFLYKNGSGNDIHPEFGKSGWRFHMV
jgi:hypothetical protein